MTKAMFAGLTSAVFRANALARVGAKFPARIEQLRSAGISALHAAVFTNDRAASAAVDTARIAVDACFVADVADYLAAFAAETAATAARYAAQSSEVLWEAIRADAAIIETGGVEALVDLPLWSHRPPSWVTEGLTLLRGGVPVGEHWDVWFDWYEQRLHGGSRGEAYELVFASVPQEEWEKEPEAANAWIKARLPKAIEAQAAESNEPPQLELAESPLGELAAALSGLDAPFAYGWTVSQRVAVVAGTQNLPDYRHFSSEEDHRHALEACRVGGERLLKSLRDRRYNARPEYGEALEYYLDDLPKTAGEGNILLANDQVRILHNMFLADAATLSEGFTGRLKSVIANQFALNAFYDSSSGTTTR